MIRQNPYRYHTPPGWNDMLSAPKDGTIIEVQCNYGIAPWFGLYRWSDAGYRAGWQKVGDEGSSFTEDESFSWRPHKGAADSYRDPTGGAQNTRAYWLQACGYNPRDYPGSELTFEQEAERDKGAVSANKETWGGTRKPSLIRRVADLVFGEGYS